MDHILIFQNDGTIKDFVGSYSQYRESERMRSKSSGGASRSSVASRTARENGHVGGTPTDSSGASTGARKLTYKEQRELEKLEKDIEALTAEKAELEAKLSGGLTDVAELQSASTRFSEVSEMLDSLETRWLELSI